MNSDFVNTNWNNSISVPVKCKAYNDFLLRKKRKCSFHEIIIPHKLKEKLTVKLLNDVMPEELVLVKPQKNTNKEDNTKSNNQNTTTNNTSADNNNSKESKNKCEKEINPEKKQEEEIKDILNEISEITSSLELFEMESRKKRMIKLLGIMADNIDEDAINTDDLTNEFFLGNANMNK